jgi:CheY-like chemotaxis protein
MRRGVCIGGDRAGAGRRYSPCMGQRHPCHRNEREAERFHAFGSMVVHDFNNALFAIKGRTQLLARRVEDDATRASLAEILSSVDLIESMLGHLRAACRSESLAEGATPLRALLEDAATRIDDGADPVGRIAAATPSDLRCDLSTQALATALGQCLAAHHCFGVDEPRTTTTLEESDYPRLSIEIRSTAADMQLPVFEKPSLLSGDLALPCIGLLAAQRAVREASGRVDWRTEPSGEARSRDFVTILSFEVARGIPLVSATGTDDDDDGCDPRPAPPARRVLIADDDPAVRAILVAVLESVGDEVDTIEDPAAIAARTDLGTFDVAILDAGGGGLEALERLRARGEDLPVLLASGDLVERPGDPRTRSAMKPVDLALLDRTLAELAAMRQRA